MRQQIQLPVEERPHVEMTMGLQYFRSCDAALALSAIELKYHSEIVRNIEAATIATQTLEGMRTRWMKMHSIQFL